MTGPLRLGKPTECFTRFGRWLLTRRARILFCVTKALEPTRCEFRIRGRLSQSLLGAFPGLDAKVMGAETVLTGPLADQAAVHGVLAQIEALHLELLEFRRLSVAASAGQAAQHGERAQDRTRSDRP
jgi:hypothetical protein